MLINYLLVSYKQLSFEGIKSYTQIFACTGALVPLPLALLKGQLYCEHWVKHLAQGLAHEMQVPFTSHPPYESHLSSPYF